MRTYDIITFDCYGTLIDWNAGIVQAFQEAAAADGVELEPEDILHAYHDAEPLVERESYRPYREVLSQVAQECAGPLGWTLDSTPASVFELRPTPGWLAERDSRQGGDEQSERDGHRERSGDHRILAHGNATSNMPYCTRQPWKRSKLLLPGAGLLRMFHPTET